MTGAAILEVETRGKSDATFEVWRRIADGKTGVLFAWCGRAVALLAGRDDAARALDEFGRRLGVAFQAADDLRDVCDPALGKDRFSDIRSKTPSSVLVLALREAPELRERLRVAWAWPTPPEALVTELGAAVAARGGPAARAFVEQEIEAAQRAARRASPRDGADWAPDLARFGQQFLRGLGV
jgi:geranylgeranyl pyrophosphate synthase